MRNGAVHYVKRFSGPVRPERLPGQDQCWRCGTMLRWLGVARECVDCDRTRAAFPDNTPPPS